MPTKLQEQIRAACVTLVGMRTGLRILPALPQPVPTPCRPDLPTGLPPNAPPCFCLALPPPNLCSGLSRPAQTFLLDPAPLSQRIDMCWSNLLPCNREHAVKHACDTWEPEQGIHRFLYPHWRVCVLEHLLILTSHL